MLHKESVVLIMRNWESIEENLIKTLNIIFKNYEVNELSSYEKRKIIFEYLSSILSYDYDMLEKIRNFEINRSKIIRDPIQELDNVINNKKGICNAISQYYKLLLEKVGIKSYCVICDDGTEVNHQLNLVYDSDNNSYSFDDITSVIVKRGIVEEYFDYDLEYASSINQGNKNVMNNQCFFVLPEDYINYLVGRDNNLSENLDRLPYNIVSIKSKHKNK